MQIKAFTFTTMGPVQRNMDRPFSRCHAELSLVEDGDPAESMITFNIVYRGSDSETIAAPRRKILAECVHLLTEGARLLAGETVESLDETMTAQTLALGAAAADGCSHAL
jgi:hypothetical protein